MLKQKITDYIKKYHFYCYRKAIRNKYFSIKAGDERNRANTDKKVRLINKKQSKYTVQKNSFINDTSSSENESESLYYTALTNPHASNIVSDKLNTVSSSVQRYDILLFTFCEFHTTIQSTIPKFFL